MENDDNTLTTDEGKLPESLSEMQGAFVGTLVRNNRKIREDRALTIVSDARIKYKRAVEDIEIEIAQAKRDREAMLDLSPTDAQSLILASEFNTVAFVEKDIKLGVKIRNLEISLDIARTRFKHLFGK